MPAPTEGQRWLIRGVNWLGDAIMATPALARIRQAHPTVHLTLLTPAKLADLWPGHAAVDAVIAVTPDMGLWTVSRLLRRGRFDQAIVLPNSQRSALEPWLAGIPCRVGLARPGRNWLLTHVVQAHPDMVRMHRRSEREVRALIAADHRRSRETHPPRAHHIHHYLRLAAAVGGNPEPLAPCIPIDPVRQRATLERLGLARDAQPSVPWLGLNAGAEFGPAKRWPADRFVAAAVAVRKRLACRWLILGGPGDRALAEFIADGMQRAGAGSGSGSSRAGTGGEVVVLAGRTTLRETADVMAACRAVLTNDTGPMHLAAAVGTRVVALFGSTDPALTAPGLPGDPTHQLLIGEAACAPCFRRECPVDLRCLGSLSVEQVVEAVVGMARDGEGDGRRRLANH